MKQLVWFTGGLLLGLTVLSITKAAVPKDQITNDTALYQKLSEINVRKQAKLDFDSDIGHLAEMENLYREKLPASKRSRLKGAMQRISSQKYQYSGQSSK